MSSGCLALNASFEPLRLMSLKRAVRLVVQEKADIVEAHPTEKVRAQNITIPRPVVIKLRRLVRVPRRYRRQVTNTFLFARDHYRCQYCGRHEDELQGREFLNRDHVIPKSKGGGNDWTNVVTACSSCNSKKENKTPQEAGLKLQSVPSEPHLVYLLWTVRKLTPMQRKYIELFYGKEALETLTRPEWQR